MLAGHPFVGKTMLVSSLLKTMESGSDFLGRGTQRATAVVVTEEHEATLRPRAELLRLLELRSDFVGRSSGVFRVEWPALIEQATAHALRQAHKLLVVDTFTGLAGLSPEEENDAGAITARLRPLQAAAGEGLAVLFLHHLNKNGQPRGSSAFRGVTETAIQLQRAKGAAGVPRRDSHDRRRTSRGVRRNPLSRCCVRRVRRRTRGDRRETRNRDPSPFRVTLTSCLNDHHRLSGVSAA